MRIRLGWLGQTIEPVIVKRAASRTPVPDPRSN